MPESASLPDSGCLRPKSLESLLMTMTQLARRTPLLHEA
jgi:hypothetical protein